MTGADRGWLRAAGGPVEQFHGMDEHAHHSRSRAE